MCPHFHHYTRRTQPLEKCSQILRRRPQLPFRQRFPLQTQNAVVAPLVTQIYAHCQTVEVGAKLTALMLFSGTRCCTFFGCSFSFSFPTSSASTSFVSRCTGPRDFARFDVGSLFI
jgi:hypothetical protein